MQKPTILRAVSCAAVFTLSGIVQGEAKLPMVGEREWVGYYAVVVSKKYSFGITLDGQGKLLITGKDGKPMIHDAVNVDFTIEEVSPDGSIVGKTIIPDSLESVQPASMKLKDVVIKGKAQDDVLFEITATETGGGLLLGGKISSQGTVKSPLRFSIGVRFPEITPFFEKSSEKEKDEKKQKREMEKLMKEERLSVKWIDGKSEKVSIAEPIDGAGPTVSGPGVSFLSGEFSRLNRSKLEIMAAPNSAMVVKNDPSKALMMGFSVVWRADMAKDPQSKARLSLQVK